MTMNDKINRLASARSAKIGPDRPFGALLVGFFIFDLDSLISYQGLAENEAALKRAVAENRLITILAYMAVYITAVAFSLPGALWLSLAGGLMFGTLVGGVIIVISATLGASGLFVAARYIIGDTLRARAGPALQKFEAAFNRDAWSYMLVLRLLPIFPFFIVNLGAALVGVRFPIFLLTTFSALCRGLLFLLPSEMVFRFYCNRAETGFKRHAKP